MSRLAGWLAAAGFLAVLLAPAAAHADVNDFTVTRFSSNQVLTMDDPQGQLAITERITVNFTDNNHGIERAIPERYKGHSLQTRIDSVSSDTGAPDQYQTVISNGNHVLRIGDPNRTVTGTQEYTIKYTLRNVITFYNDHDELYWDVNGDGWRQPFTLVVATVALPEGTTLSAEPQCYTGSFGSTASDCEQAIADGIYQVGASKPLGSGQTLSYVLKFKPGSFHAETWQERVADYAKPVASLLLPILLFGGGAIWYWWRYGRDVRSPAVIVPQYDASKGFRPLYVGLLMDFKVDNRDITATIIDLAIQGYIRIIETKQDRLILKDKVMYTLELLRVDFTELDETEKMILKAMFTKQQIGDKLELTASNKALYSIVGSLNATAKDALTKSGYLRDKSSATRSKYIAAYVIGAVIISVVAYVLGHSGLLFVGLAIGVVIAILCMQALDARTAQGIAAKQHIEGLKRYLTVAEKDRLAKLQSPNAPYASTSAEPVKTVELFERLLPYAVVLGVENDWAKAFDSIYGVPPDWYQGTWTAFNAHMLTSTLSQGVGTALNNSFSAPSSSSGGGFAGGGGGGGGGGGW